MNRILFSTRGWVVATLAALGFTTAISFVRAQSIGANSVTFQGGSAIPVRGVPVNQRGIGFGFSLPGPVFFGGYPRPAAVMPNTPVIQRNMGQGKTPQFNTLGNQGGAAGQQGAQGGALGGAQGGIGGAQGGAQGGIGGGIGGIGGGIAGGVGGGIGGAAGQSGGVGIGGGLAAQGQNFLNPAANFGFPQIPVGYIGGTTGGQITGAGVAGNSGQLGVGINGGGVNGNQGNAGGIGGAGGGFGGGGIGGKGAGFAGANGI